MEKYGIASITKKKHIKERYLFIRDQIDQGDMRVKYRPTENMWVDILNKPKQGKIFRETRGE